MTAAQRCLLGASCLVLGAALAAWAHAIGLGRDAQAWVAILFAALALGFAAGGHGSGSG